MAASTPNDPWRHPEDPPKRDLRLRSEPPPREESAPPPPSVQEVLQDNLMREAERPINGRVSEHRAHTRRLRSWIVGLVVVNAMVLGLMIFFQNLIVYLLGAAGMISFSLAYSWMMLQVRDNF